MKTFTPSQKMRDNGVKIFPTAKAASYMYYPRSWKILEMSHTYCNKMTIILNSHLQVSQLRNLVVHGHEFNYHGIEAFLPSKDAHIMLKFLPIILFLNCHNFTLLFFYFAPLFLQLFHQKAKIHLHKMEAG